MLIKGKCETIDVAVCTLFENGHHFGVAALVNSLYKQGYKGSIYAGYKGRLPLWAREAAFDTQLDWENALTLSVQPDLQIHFLPIDTNKHLAHCKPDFMLELVAKVAKDADGIAYFDPDIVVTNKWSFFLRWMSHGVAIVHEIVSNDMPPTHPIRMEWQKVIDRMNKTTRRALYSYLNCGFCAVTKENIEFLRLWSEVIAVAISEYEMNPSQFSTFDRTSTFWSIDQDAFNIAAMCCESPISEMGPEAMDFIHAGWTMSHATGSPKPWEKRFLLAALDGRPPTKAEKEYWSNALGLINAHSSAHYRIKHFSITLAALIGRFYRRH